MSSEEVIAFIDAIAQPWQVGGARTLREAILEAVPDALERIQYKKPHYLVGKQYLAVISPSKSALSLTIFNATDLDAPDGFFQKDGPPERKTAKFTENDAIDASLVTRLVSEAAASLV